MGVGGGLEYRGRLPLQEQRDIESQMVLRPSHSYNFGGYLKVISDEWPMVARMYMTRLTMEVKPGTVIL